MPSVLPLKPRDAAAAALPHALRAIPDGAQLCLVSSTYSQEVLLPPRCPRRRPLSLIDPDLPLSQENLCHTRLWAGLSAIPSQPGGAAAPSLPQAPHAVPDGAQLRRIEHVQQVVDLRRRLRGGC